MGAFADDASGKRHYMGVYEVEQDYDRFITLGAKKYAYEQDGRCHVTCAGVDKSLGGPELEQHGGLEAFRTGFTFREAGGTEAVYNDNCDFWIQRDGHDLHITSNVVIRPSEYTLGITGEYKFLLHWLLGRLFVEAIPMHPGLRQRRSCAMSTAVTAAPATRMSWLTANTR